jgi:hypothetical protein
VADNITLNTGSGGDVVGADDVTSVKYQRVKIVPGGDGAVNLSGCTSYSYLSAASANQDSQHPKASAGVVYGLTVTNSNTSARYIKLYNLASGATSASTVYRRYMIPAGGGIREEFPYGVTFTTGIGFRLTTGAADNNAGAVAADEIMVNLDYV